jgi:hypothetical protein
LIGLETPLIHVWPEAPPKRYRNKEWDSHILPELGFAFPLTERKISDTKEVQALFSW